MTPSGRDARCLLLSGFTDQEGGAELSLIHLLRHGGGLGVEWLYGGINEGEIAEAARGAGVETLVARGGRMRQAHRVAWSAWQLGRFARRRRADLILGWMPITHVRGTLVSAFSGVPAAWFQKHGVGDGDRQARLIARLPARGILANSRPTAEAQARLSPRQPILVAPSGVDLAEFDPARLPSPAACRAELGINGGPVIVLVGRLQRWKGQHVLVEAMPAVRRRYPRARAVLVGGPHRHEPEYADFLRQQIAKLGVGDAVTITGDRPHDSIPRWMQAADVVVHASDNEPFGIVVVEAMALGKPLVAGGRGGPTQVVTPGVDGLLAPYGDPAALAGAVLRYLDEPAFAVKVGEAARRRAAEFSVEMFCRRVAAGVRRLAGGPALAAGIYEYDAELDDFALA